MHPPTTVVADIDRATGSHAVYMVDDMGTVLERYEVEHGAGDDHARSANKAVVRDRRYSAWDSPAGSVVHTGSIVHLEPVRHHESEDGSAS